MGAGAMDVVMNGLLIAATLFAGLYCYVLAGRVRALKSLDSGLGGSIVTLTRQIELARATLDEARAGSRETRQDLGQLTARADAAAAQLRLLLAAIEAAGPAAPVERPAAQLSPTRETAADPAPPPPLAAPARRPRRAPPRGSGSAPGAAAGRPGPRPWRRCSRPTTANPRCPSRAARCRSTRCCAGAPRPSRPPPSRRAKRT